ncbi:MAG: hypothetical protein EOM50_22685 [Erysipelotrichia bacterium]|nr:hypothetical protein [Erysipelotrichia bacterium]
MSLLKRMEILKNDPAPDRKESGIKENKDISTRPGIADPLFTIKERVRTLTIEALNDVEGSDEKLVREKIEEILDQESSGITRVEKSRIIDFLAKARSKGIKTVFDISSPILKELLKYKPFLIKPNDEELLSIFGIEINSDRDVINAFKSLKEIGAQNIMLTLGAKGMYVNYLNKIYYAAPIEVKLISSACAGDSSLGAFISKMETDVIEAIKLATATGANVAESHGIGDLKNVEQYKNKVSIREVSYE